MSGSFLVKKESGRRRSALMAEIDTDDSAIFLAGLGICAPKSG